MWVLTLGVNIWVLTETLALAALTNHLGRLLVAELFIVQKSNDVHELFV